MRGISMKRQAAAACLFAGILFTAVAGAVDVSITGTLVESLPCDINGNRRIDVTFGDDVIINKINGSAYSVNIPYSVVCADTTGTVRLSVTGMPVSFDSAAVETSTDGLGIRLMLGGNGFVINAAGTVIDTTALPVLSAVPVVDPARSPDEGRFTATATLLANYD